MIVIHCKYNSVSILRAGQVGALVKYTSILEGNKLVGNNSMIVIHCKYISEPILRASQVGALVKYTSILEGNKLVGNKYSQ